MATNKSFIKVFFVGEKEGFVCNFNGDASTVINGRDQLASQIGYDIHDMMEADFDHQDIDIIFGYRIDYTLTPITKAPFE